MDAINAVSSPHTKAPDPMRMSRSNENAVPKIFLPKNPQAWACAMAFFSRATASGYSART